MGVSVALGDEASGEPLSPRGSTTMMSGTHTIMVDDTDGRMGEHADANACVSCK